MPQTPRSAIQAARLAQGLSQQELAQIADCSVSYVRQVESGYSPKRSGVAYARVLTGLGLSEKNERPPCNPDVGDDRLDGSGPDAG